MFFSIAQLQNDVFNPSNPPMIEVQYGGFGAQMGSYKQQNRHFVPQSWADLMGWKRWNVFFFILKLSNGKTFRMHCFTEQADTMRLL